MGPSVWGSPKPPKLGPRNRSRGGSPKPPGATLVFEVRTQPLKEEIKDTILQREDDLLEEGYALLFVLDYLRMKFPLKRKGTMDCNRWRQINMNFEQYCRLWKDICR